MTNNDINNIFEAHPENEGVIRDLIDTLNDKNVEVSPFVGAGMSAPIFPLWGQALKEIMKTHLFSPESRKQIEEYLSEYKYEVAASEIEKALPGIRYKDALRRIFNSKKINEQVLKDMPVSMLPKLFTRTVFTTNFERVINKVYQCNTLITMKSSEDKKSEVLRSKEKLYIVKLHGDIEDGDIVFTNEEYNDCYGESFNTSYVSFLESLFASRAMLFLGCSLKEDRTFELLKRISEKGTYPHYAFLEIQDDLNSEAFLERQNILSNANIRCIWYPKGQHQLVKVFLQYLINNTLAACSGEGISNHIDSKIFSYYYSNQRDTLLGSKIVGIREDSKLKDILPQSYIDPTIQERNKGKMKFSEFIKQYSFKSGVALLSTPGMGKSTSLKAIIIKDYYKNFSNVLFYYLEAKDFIKQTDNIKETDDIFIHIIQNRFPELTLPNESRIVLLIDSCDELSLSNKQKFIANYKKCISLLGSDRVIWIGCRLDFYNRYYEKEFASTIDYKLHICEWDRSKSDALINSILAENGKTDKQITETKKKISAMESKNPASSFWRKNPFYLSLFLFCVADQDFTECARINIDNAYELYGLFYSKWLEKHNVKTVAKQNKVRDIHTRIALAIYTHKGESLKIKDILRIEDVSNICNKREIMDLLRMSPDINENDRKAENLKVDRFWHDSFGEFLIAADLVDFFKAPREQDVIDKKDSHLRNIVNYDVNIFIKEAFHTLSSEKAINICERLLSLYIQLKSREKDYSKERWNLLYYVGRLNASTSETKARLIQLQKNILLEALKYETDQRIKRTAIISLMNVYENKDVEIEDKIIEYVSTLTYESEADICNRSIQLVYCGDIGYDDKKNMSVEFGDLNNFTDDNKVSWSRTKKYILDRLGKDDKASLQYRLWDLKTLYLFFKSRNWELIEPEDYIIVSKTIIYDNIYSEKIQKLLAKQKSEILVEMEKNLGVKNIDKVI